MDKDYFMNAGIPWSGINCTAAEQFLNPSSDHFSHFDSSLSSIVSYPAVAAASAPASEAFLLRELIGTLNGASSSGVATASRNNDSSYSTPISSPKLHLTMLDQINLSPNLGNSVALTPPLPSLSSDPGFAERAAKFSCFGSRSFNGRATTQLALNISESQHRSKSPLMNAKLPRVCSSPSLKQQAGSSPENKNLTEIRSLEKKLGKFSGSAANSNEESSLSDQIHSGETGSGSKLSNELNSRKRKVASKSKPKENGSAKEVEGDDDDGNAKRLKNENVDEEKANQKPPEPPKDYIHVRARRGQATDSHSLAERVRREKISERMKLLQDLVPGCNKVTGKALMLDEIINYVQSLQRQVEFLSMKLASVNPELDFNADNILSKGMFQQNATLPQQLYPMDYHQNVQQPMHNNTDVPGGLPLGIQLSSVDEFTQNLPQFPGFSEDDLHSIVGFVHNSMSFHGLNQTSNMKVER